MHFGWHVLPDASVAVQSPLAPLAGAADASHVERGFLGTVMLRTIGLHDAAVSVPSLHLETPDTMYPLLQVGLQVLPEPSRALQSPTVPLPGGDDASHLRSLAYFKYARHSAKYREHARFISVILGAHALLLVEYWNICFIPTCGPMYVCGQKSCAVHAQVLSQPLFRAQALSRRRDRTPVVGS
eukprot:COSAG01_NODE_11637_length_1891_cov_8.332031_2_plen_184_part_00